VTTIAPLTRRRFSKWVARCGRHRTSGWRSPRGSLHLPKNSDQDLEELNCWVERATGWRSSSFWDRCIYGVHSLARGKRRLSGRGQVLKVAICEGLAHGAIRTAPDDGLTAGPHLERSGTEILGLLLTLGSALGLGIITRRFELGAVQGPVPRTITVAVQRHRPSTGAARL
jgi:hypothetical protein